MASSVLTLVDLEYLKLWLRCGYIIAIQIDACNRFKFRRVFHEDLISRSRYYFYIDVFSLHMVHYLVVVWGLACSDDTLSYASWSFSFSGVTHAGLVKSLGARLNVDQTEHKDRTNIDVSGMKIVHQGRFPPCHQTQVGRKR